MTTENASSRRCHPPGSAVASHRDASPPNAAAASAAFVGHFAELVPAVFVVTADGVGVEAGVVVLDGVAVVPTEGVVDSATCCSPDAGVLLLLLSLSRSHPGHTKSATRTMMAAARKPAPPTMLR